MFAHNRDKKSQIALEFLVVYSFVLVIFIVIFSLIASQRAAILSQEQYSLLQLQSQNIASYINQAEQAGSGYFATVPLAEGLVHNYYKLYVSSTGVVIANYTVGRQSVTAFGFSHAKDLDINGTVVANSNGIRIYEVPTYKGFVTISNLRGMIYIDQEPVSISQLAQSALVTQRWNVKAASFSNNAEKMSYIKIGNSQSLTLGNSFSVSLWFYANGCGTIVGKQDSSAFSMNIVSQCGAGYSGNDVLDVNYMGSTDISANIPSMSWVNVAATVNGTDSTIDLYVNGEKVADSIITNTQQNQNNLYIGNGDYPFNGSVANLQMYRNVLSPDQVSGLYLGGIGEGPTNGELVGWWPLDGNANDYSGFGNQGIPENSPQYLDVIQLNSKVYSASGNVLNGVPVGFASSVGSASGNEAFSTRYTDSNGIAYSFITANVLSNSGNVTADVFGGNLSTTGNLIGWWPLDSGYGSNIPDFSMSADAGSFNGVWAPYVNQTNFISPNFDSSISCVGKSGPYSSSLTQNATQSLFNVINNDTFTLVAWAYPASTGGQQGIFGNWNDSNSLGPTGIQVNAADSSQCTALYVSSNQLLFPNSTCSLPENTWNMVVGEYNGNTGSASVYLNNRLLVSNSFPEGLSLGINNTPYQIGYDLAGGSNFNGVLTNIQLYDSYLSKEQIGLLYGSGLASPPLGNSGLVGWWPLINNQNDYSYNNGNGTINSACPPGHAGTSGQSSAKIVYINNAYNNTQSPIGPGFATFNGVSNAVIPFNSNLESAAGSFTVSLWFSSFNSGTEPIEQQLVSVGGSAGSPTKYFNVSICGDYTCNGITGIFGVVGDGSTSSQITYPFTFRKNTWYSLTEVFAQNRWTIYIDGINVSSGNSGISTPYLIGNGENIYIGGSGSNGFTGQIANLQIYNSALTPQQAMQLYVQGLPTQYRMNISVG